VARVLVTGGAGFIGSHLTHALIAEGHEVRVVDDFSTGRLSNLYGVLDAIHLMEGSITDRAFVYDAADEVDFCFHEAALPSVQRSIEDPEASNAVNVDGTLNVFLACRDAGVKRVVFASSSSVYGATGNVALEESMPCAPLSPYGVSKHTAEHYARVFSELYEIDIVGLRYFNVFGPKQDPLSPYAAVIPLFISAMRAGNSPRVFGDGTQSRDFTYVDNVVAANMAAMRATERIAGIYNVACGKSTSVLTLVKTLNDLLGTNLEPAFEPPRKGEIPWSLANISKARSAFGYEPIVTLSDGLANTIAWYAPQEAAPAAAS